MLYGARNEACIDGEAKAVLVRMTTIVDVSGMVMAAPRDMEAAVGMVPAVFANRLLVLCIERQVVE